MPFVWNLKALYSNDFPKGLHRDMFTIGAIIKLTNLYGAIDAPKRAQ
jgi:hypothetical protein